MGLDHNPKEPNTVGIDVDFIELSESSSKQPWKAEAHTRFLASKNVAQEAVCKKAETILREEIEGVARKVDPPKVAHDIYPTDVACKEYPAEVIRNLDTPDVVCDVDLPEAVRNVYPPQAGSKVGQPEAVRIVDPTEVAYKVDPSEVVSKIDPPEVARNEDSSEVPPRTPTSFSEFDEQISLGDSTSSESKYQKLTTKRYEEPTETEKHKIMDRRYVNTKSQSATIRMIVHDLAGEAIYYDTHYLFLKSHAPYIFVHDLMKPKKHKVVIIFFIFQRKHAQTKIFVKKLYPVPVDHQLKVKTHVVEILYVVKPLVYKSKLSYL